MRQPTLLIVSAIDNLGKGGSANGVQNLNVLFGWHERAVEILAELEEAGRAAAIHDRIARLAESYPQRIYGMIQINPHTDRPVFQAEAERCVKDLGFVGVKIHPPGYGVNPRYFFHFTSEFVLASDFLSGVVKTMLIPLDGSARRFVTLSGPERDELLTRAAPYTYGGYPFHYDPTLDRILHYKGQAGKVYQIDPDSWEVTEFPTRGARPPAWKMDSGIWNKFLPVPALGGYAYVHDWDSDVYFLRTGPPRARSKP